MGVIYQTTPIPVDSYSRRVADMYNENEDLVLSTGFLTFFGRAASGGQTLFSPDAGEVEIAIIRGQEKLGALIPRGIGGRNLDGKNAQGQKYTGFNRVYPLAEEEGSIGSDQLLTRQPNEQPYEQRMRRERMRNLGRDIHMDHMRKQIRTFEYLGAQSILTGKMPSILGTTDPDLIYDFRRNPDNTFAAGGAWTNIASDIFNDLDIGATRIRINGKANCDGVVTDKVSFRGFQKNTEVLAMADNRRYDVAWVGTGDNRVPPKFNDWVAGGFQPRARVVTPGGKELWIFVYEEYYEDDAGDPQLYLPEGNALMFYSGARCDRYFGPEDKFPMTLQRAQLYREHFGYSPESTPMPPNIKNQSATINPAMFYHDAYMAEGAKAITCRTQSAPIFASTRTDAFARITGTV